MLKTEKHAEDFVYRSYMKAAKHLKYEAADSEKRHPEYTRTVIRQLDKRCGRENILVTGSKGKGSVSVMISEILQAHGLDTGLLTSPHISAFNERIRINSSPIQESELVRVCNVIQPTAELIDSTIAADEYISPIGIQVLAALLHFTGKTDINIFECGKGVRFDDVNNLSRSYSVINRIFAEHTRELGGSVGEIADDKADIITEGQKFAYTAKQSAEVMDILEKRAKRCGVRLKKYGADFRCENIGITKNGTVFDAVTSKGEYRGLSLGLLGEYQAENFALALAVCEDVLENLDGDAVKAAAKAVKWAGRAEIISRSPLIIADACINRESALGLKNILKCIGFNRLSCVIGVPSDKDYAGVAEVMKDIAEELIFTAADNPHYRFDKAQAKCVGGARFVKESKKAVEAAVKSGADTVCIMGTTALIAEIYGGTNETAEIYQGGN